jgi:hypothetical protein
MAIITTGKTFGTTDPVTSVDLNNVANAATFNDPVDETSLELITSGTNIGKLQIKDNGVTLAKMATQADQTVLGNVSGGTAVPTAVPIVGASGVLKNDDALGTSDTQGATQGNIKAYVDANVLTPSYVGISSNSSLTITQTDTSTTTHTYPIADFVGTGFNAAKVTGFYVQITASCRRLSTKTIADVKATFPDGSDHILLGHSCDTPEDQTSESRGTVFCPVSIGQTNLVIKPTLSGDTRTTTFTIVGCTQFV